MTTSRLAPLLLAACGCALTGRHAVRAPLSTEGELLVALQPLTGDDLHGGSLEALSVTALRGETEMPLELLLPRAEADPVATQRLLARGRLAPGAYSGIAVRLKPPPATTPGPSPAPPQPIRVEVPFTIAARHAALVELHARFESVEDEEEGRKPMLIPAFIAAQGPRTLPQAAAFCSDASDHEVLLFDKDARRVTAALPTGRSPWGLAVDAIGNRLYVALSDEDQISVVDTGTGEELNRIRLHLGDQPRELALTPDRTVLVSANAGTNTVSVIDTGSMVEIDRVAVGVEPTSLLMDRRGQRVYVFNRGSNTFGVVDVVSRTLVATALTDEQPLRGQFNRAGSKLYVAHARSPFLVVYSLPDLSVQSRVYIGLGTSAIKVDAKSDLIFVARSGDTRLFVYDPFSLIPIDRVEAVEGATYLAIDDAQNALFALSPDGRTVSVLDLSSRKPLPRFEVGEDARVLALPGERN